MPTETESRRNIELKVQVGPDAFAAIRQRLESLVCAPIQRLHQVDTYFRVERGRLKLRELRTTDGPTKVERAELIAYVRPDDPGSRWSAYRVVPIAANVAADVLDALLMTRDRLCGVEKHRQVGLIGQTRVHLDGVVGLGSYVELETVVTTQLDEVALAEHERAIAALGLAKHPSVAGSYSDLALAGR